MCVLNSVHQRANSGLPVVMAEAQGAHANTCGLLKFGLNTSTLLPLPYSVGQSGQALVLGDDEICKGHGMRKSSVICHKSLKHKLLLVEAK